jgi:hypothetical protein
MYGRRFDGLVAFFTAGTRRGLLQRLAVLPISGIFVAFAAGANDAGSSKKRKRKKCRPKSRTKTCSGRCGTVRNNCKKRVDCGPCNCGPCPSCQTCNTTTGACEIVADRTSCGGSDICCNGICCDGCCGGDGSCGPCLAFTTSTTHNGDLGGLIGADAICQDLADNAPTPLPGSYKAWISTGTGVGESPATRFRRSGQGYVRIDGVVVANSWDDLTDGTIDNPIFAMEDGSPVPPPSGNVPIWTNTAADGTVVSEEPRNCANWASADATLTGRLGMADPIVTDQNWTELGSVQFCDFENARLYCFQQD